MLDRFVAFAGLLAMTELMPPHQITPWREIVLDHGDAHGTARAISPFRPREA